MVETINARNISNYGDLLTADEMAAMPELLRERCGVANLRRSFRCPNPAHDDREPSAKYYEDGNTVHCFDFDNSGYVKTATEVASDNSSLLRNIRRHENALEGAPVGIGRTVMAVSRGLGESVPDEGDMHVMFDDSIITDTAVEKEQDLREVGAGLMDVWEYRCKWYGEDEETAKARADEETAKARADELGAAKMSA